MKHILSVFFLTVSSIVALSVINFAAAQALPLAPTVLADTQSKSDACSGLNQLAGKSGTNCEKAGGKDSAGQDAIANIAATVVNIISFIGGIAAVILIIVGGVKFITSGGDSQGVASARNTIIYALIGLVVVALAQVIVHFVLNAVINNKVVG